MLYSGLIELKMHLYCVYLIKQIIMLSVFFFWRCDHQNNAGRHLFPSMVVPLNFTSATRCHILLQVNKKADVILLYRDFIIHASFIHKKQFWDFLDCVNAWVKLRHSKSTIVFRFTLEINASLKWGRFQFRHSIYKIYLYFKTTKNVPSTSCLWSLQVQWYNPSLQAGQVSYCQTSMQPNSQY